MFSVGWFSGLSGVVQTRVTLLARHHKAKAFSSMGSSLLSVRKSVTLRLGKLNHAGVTITGKVGSIELNIPEHGAIANDLRIVGLPGHSSLDRATSNAVYFNQSPILLEA